MEDKILERMYELRKVTGYHAKYIVLNEYTWYKLKHEMLDKNPYGGNYKTDKDGAELHGVPILIKADSHRQEEYIEIIPNTLY